MDVGSTNEELMPGCEGMDRMSNADEGTRIQTNVEVIREYLRSEFEGFKLTDKSEGPFGHLFTVTNISAYARYALKVSGPRLSDSSNTPKRIKRQLALDKVAGKMKAKESGEPYSWG